MSDFPEPRPAAGIAIRLPQLDEIKTMLATVLEGRPRQALYTIEQAWRLKYAAVIEAGAVSLDTMKKTLALQPRGGIPDTWSSGKKVWRDETIQAWLGIGDDDLPMYLKLHNPCCIIPERIFEAIKRRAS